MAEEVYPSEQSVYAPHGRLPIEEATNPPYKSRFRAKCTLVAMMAIPPCSSCRRYPADTLNFDGTAVVIFQPAEEGGGGGKAMVDDGLMDRFGIGEVYGMHNYPACRSVALVSAPER